MKTVKFVICMLVAMCTVSVTAQAQTYTNQFTGLGSSALFLELGQAAVARATAIKPTGYSVCSWSTKDAGAALADRIYAFDQAPAISNTGNFWAVWYQNGACTTVPTSGTVAIWSYSQQDSAVGNRCVFRTGTQAQECILVVPAAGTGTVTDVGGANLISGQTDITTPLPAKIISTLNGSQFGVSGTDVRPEDSQFQLYRALQPTSTLLGQIYPGLGLASGNSTCLTIAVKGGSYDGGAGTGGAGTFGNPGSVTAAEFALPNGTDPCTKAKAVTSATVIPVAATPVVVAVNNSNAAGFGNTAIKNINRYELAEFLDGDLCRPADLIPGSGATSKVFSTTLIREPFSGTYTTTEYNAVATHTVIGSQEAGITAPQTQPTVWTTCNGKGGLRSRTTSTGNEVYAIQNVTDALGYFFWSVSNAKAFTSTNGTPGNGKYLTVAGIDPIQSTYSNGCIPVAAETTPGCELANVNFAHIYDGTYPIWSIQRLVTTSNTPSVQAAEAVALSAAAQAQVGPSLPDFVPASSPNFHQFHSHFLPNVPVSIQGGLTVANGNCGAVESGGDVGGAVYNVQSDKDYCSDFGVKNGITNVNLGGAAKGNGNPGQRQ